MISKLCKYDNKRNKHSRREFDEGRGELSLEYYNKLSEQYLINKAIIEKYKLDVQLTEDEKQHVKKLAEKYIFDELK